MDRLLVVAGRDYKTVAASADRLHFARTSRPTWSLILGIILAPIIIGIPLLLMKRTETWVAAIEEDHRTVQVHVTGRVLPLTMLQLHEALGAPATPIAPTQIGIIEDVRMPGRPAPGQPVNEATIPSAPNTETNVESTLVSSTSKQPPASTSERVGETTFAKRAEAVPASASARLPKHSPDRWAPPPVELESDEEQPPAGLTVVRPPGNRSNELPTAPKIPVVSFDTGELLHLEDGEIAFVGRSPVAIGSTAGHQLLVIDDPDRSISKTHLRIVRKTEALEVVDLGSTNGSACKVGPGRPFESMKPNEVIAVCSGATIQFGNRSFVVTSEPTREGSSGVVEVAAT